MAPFFVSGCTAGTRTGFGRRPAREEKRDARERVSRKPRRKGRWPGWPRLRRASPPFGTIAINKGITASRRSPFFGFLGPSGWNVARRVNLVREGLGLNSLLCLRIPGQFSVITINKGVLAYRRNSAPAMTTQELGLQFLR